MDLNETLCSKCGTPLETRDLYCGECGEPAGPPSRQKRPGAEERLSPPVKAIEKEPAKDGRTRKSRYKIILVGLLILLVLSFGAWVGYKTIILPKAPFNTTPLPPQTMPSPRPQPRTDSGSIQEGSNPSPRIRGGWIGITIQDVPWDLAGRIGLATPSGVLVIACEPNSPSLRAGILPGDVLLQMNEVQLVNRMDLIQRIDHQNPGKTIRFVVWRNGTVYTTPVMVAERPFNLNEQKRLEARRYAAAYEACFAQFCPGCNSPLDLFKTQTPNCRQCETNNKSHIEACANARRRP